jgi:hypothetical protein
MKRPENLIYAVDEWPPLPKLALLGLKQVFLVTIYLVLLVIELREAGASQFVWPSEPEGWRRVYV